VKKLFFVLIGALIATLAAAAAARDERQTPVASRLRVMTYNIHAGDVSLDAIASVIRAANVDLAALQEVDVHWGERSHFEDQAARLADALRMDVRFAPIYRLAGADATAPPREFGVALLSRLPIRSFENLPLTRLSTQDAAPVPAPAPGLLAADVAAGGGTVRVFNTHLDYRADPAVRRRQVAEMVVAVGDVSRPVLVFGDMNAEPAAPELAPLLATLRDAWPPSAGPGLTYPADAPAKRIDYVLVSPHFRVVSASVVETHASDHRPVVVDLVF
jgi:endonuclease/exonuclease/phosphatase family metal-dependent hydrolase